MDWVIFTFLSKHKGSSARQIRFNSSPYDSQITEADHHPCRIRKLKMSVICRCLEEKKVTTARIWSRQIENGNWETWCRKTKSVVEARNITRWYRWIMKCNFFGNTKAGNWIWEIGKTISGAPTLPMPNLQKRFVDLLCSPQSSI